MIFVYENQPVNEQERPDLKRNRTTPNETEPTKRLKSNNTPKTKSNHGHKQPVSQFNTPNVAYNRSNRFAQENLPKLTPKTTKNGSQIPKKATQSYYYDDNGKRFNFKCEKTHIKNLEGVTRTHAAKAETNAPSIKIIKGFQIETGKYKYDATIDSDISSELANYIRNMHTRNGVTKQDTIDQLYKFGFIHCTCSDIDTDLTYTNCECSGHYKIQCRPTHQMRCLESGQYEPDINIFAKEDTRYWDNKTRYVKENQKKPKMYKNGNDNNKGTFDPSQDAYFVHLVANSVENAIKMIFIIGGLCSTQSPAFHLRSAGFIFRSFISPESTLKFVVNYHKKEDFLRKLQYHHDRWNKYHEHFSDSNIDPDARKKAKKAGKKLPPSPHMAITELNLKHKTEYMRRGLRCPKLGLDCHPMWKTNWVHPWLVGNDELKCADYIQEIWNEEAKLKHFFLSTERLEPVVLVKIPQESKVNEQYVKQMEEYVRLQKESRTNPSIRVPPRPTKADIRRPTALNMLYEMRESEMLPSHAWVIQQQDEMIAAMTIHQIIGNNIDENAKRNPQYWERINSFQTMEEWSKAYSTQKIIKGDTNMIAHRFRSLEATQEQHKKALDELRMRTSEQLTIVHNKTDTNAMRLNELAKSQQAVNYELVTFWQNHPDPAIAEKAKQNPLFKELTKITQSGTTGLDAVKNHQDFERIMADHEKPYLPLNTVEDVNKWMSKPNQENYRANQEDKIKVTIVDQEKTYSRTLFKQMRANKNENNPFASTKKQLDQVAEEVTTSKSRTLAAGQCEEIAEVPSQELQKAPIKSPSQSHHMSDATSTVDTRSTITSVYDQDMDENLEPNEISDMLSLQSRIKDVDTQDFIKNLTAKDKYIQKKFHKIVSFAKYPTYKWRGCKPEDENERMVIWSSYWYKTTDGKAPTKIDPQYRQMTRKENAKIWSRLLMMRIYPVIIILKTMIQHFRNNVTIEVDTKAELEMSELCDLIAECTVFERLVNDRQFYIMMYEYFKINKHFPIRYFPMLSIDIYDAIIMVIEDVQDLTSIQFRDLENDAFIESEMSQRLVTYSEEGSSQTRIMTLDDEDERQLLPETSRAVHFRRIMAGMNVNMGGTDLTDFYEDLLNFSFSTNENSQVISPPRRMNDLADLTQISPQKDDENEITISTKGGKLIELPVSRKYNLLLDVNALKKIDTDFIYSPKSNPRTKVIVKANPGMDLSEKYLPAINEINLALKDGNFINLPPAPPRSTEIPPNSSLIIIYTNLNPSSPEKMQTRLSTLTAFYHDAQIFLLSELYINPVAFEKGQHIPIGYSFHHHEPINMGTELDPNYRIFSAILVRNDLDDYIKPKVSKCPTITSIQLKNNDLTATFTVFYRPNKTSTRRVKMNFNEMSFINSLTSIAKEGERSSSCKVVIAGDLNIDMSRSNHSKDEKKVYDAIRTMFVRYFNCVDEPTFYRSNGQRKETATYIDIAFCRNFNSVTTESVRGGKALLLNDKSKMNDGHNILKIKTSFLLNNIRVITKMTKRPKLDVQMLLKYVTGFWQSMNDKLSELLRADEAHLTAPLRSRDPRKIINGNCYRFKELQSSDFVIEFIESMMGTLLPEEMVDTPIYASQQPLSPEAIWLHNFHGVLKKSSETLSDDDPRKRILDDLSKEVNKEWKKEYKQAKKKNLVPKGKITDLTCFKLKQLLCPKDRKNGGKQECFDAQNLMNEFERLYKTIIAHVFEIDFTLNIADMIPHIPMERRFSFERFFPEWEHYNRNIKTGKQCLFSLKETTRGRKSFTNKANLTMLPLEMQKLFYEAIRGYAMAGVFPDRYCVAKAKAILKKGDVNDIKNRRFLNIGAADQQCMGKLIASCFLHFLESEKLLHSEQFGFRKYMGTDVAIASLRNRVLMRPKGMIGALVLLDLSSAFFCLPFERIMMILEKVCQPQALLFWRHLLRQRSCVLSEKGVESKLFEIPMIGVPQGEPTSPILFCLVINGIMDFSKRRVDTAHTQGYADDTILYVWGRYTKMLIEYINKTLQDAELYAKNCGFKINPSKTELMFLHDIGFVHPKTINTHLGVLTNKTSVNVLGGRITNKMGFEPQIQHVIKQLKWQLHNIRDLLFLGVKQPLIKVAFSCQTGIYSYSLGIMPKLTQKQYQDMQVVMNKALRMIAGKKDNRTGKRISQRDLLDNCNWMPTHLRHGKMALCTLNRILRNRKPDYLYHMCREHTRRGNQNFLAKNGITPRLEPHIEETKNVPLARIMFAFPMCVNHWFKVLPIYVKRKLGTLEFDAYVSFYFTRYCYHRLLGTPKEGCSKCKDTLKTVFADLNPFKEFLMHKVQRGFDFESMIRLQENNNGDLIESIFDLHLVYDAGNGEVAHRFNQKWEILMEDQQRHAD